MAQGSTLVAAYSFNEGAGTTVADSSGVGNTGTINNATWTTAGRYGNALAFNGTNAFVTINDKASLHLTTAMTLEAWVKPSTVNGVWRDVIYKGNDNYFLEGTSTISGTPAGGGTFGSVGRQVYGTAAVSTTAWTHLAFTYDRTTMRLYVNGTQVSSQAQTGNIATSTNPLQIGGDSVYGQYFNGAIDEVRVYNVALTAAQIQSDMNTPIGPPAPDTQPPTPPSNLTAAAASGSQINLSWTASTDNVGVTGYPIERCQGAGCTVFTPIATATTTSYSDTGLTSGTSYSYRVKATDAAGNPSLYSNTGSATTAAPDTQPPTVPGNLTATAVSGSQINLNWTASTDNVGVTGYRIDRCQSAGCTDFAHFVTTTATTYNDTGLLPNTTYRYQVRATDAAGNLSPYSNPASATTLAASSGLVAAYSFNEGTGTAVADASGNGNSGAIGSAAWTTSGKFGGALTFNGTTALVTIDNSVSLQLTTGMTVEAWVRPSVVDSAWRDVIYKGDDNYYLEGTSTNGGTPAGGATFGSVNQNLYGSSALAVNTWTHLAETYDGAMLRLYVNGIQVSAQAQTGNMATSTNPLQIGGDSIYGQYFMGSIDEVRVYNVALTPAQIQSDMITAIGSGSLPGISLSTNSLTFPDQPVNITSSAKTVTVTNTGSAPLSISSISISGPSAVDFNQTTNCGSLVPPNASCTISVTFTPTGTGSRTATLTIQHNAPGGPQTVALSGNGTPASGLLITPRVAALTFTQTQQFTTGASVFWSVDGIVGGSASSGTITTTGLYTPPSNVGIHTVTATTSDQTVSANATVYITNYPGTFTHHNDNLRTGQNLNEIALTAANVIPTKFGKLFSYALDGTAYASPLYVANVNIPGQGFHNVVYVATAHNSVYAFDADGRSSNPLWKVSFIGPGVTAVPASDTGECCDIAPEIGITGTPVIDSASGTLYVVAKTKESGTYRQRLHALDITSGAERFGGPVLIQASVSGTGSGASGGRVPFDPLHENQRPALLLSNGVVHIAFGSHGDAPPYHGWVLGYSAQTLQQVMVFNASPNGIGAGIWMGGGGLATDAAGNIYFTTSNGTFDLNTGGEDHGDTFVKIAPDGTVLDYFTPYDQSNMDVHNWDLGSAGLLLLPNQSGANPHLMLSAGKTGTIYMMNRDDMGHYNPSSNNQIVQSLVSIFPNGTPEPGNDAPPVYFNGSVYFSPINDAIMAFRLTNGLLSTSPTSRSSATYVDRGGSLAVSANGSSNGILWAVQRTGATTPGALHAYDPANLGVEFYNSNQSGSRDTLDVAAKFSVPLVANGKVFVASISELTIYGLLP